MTLPEDYLERVYAGVLGKMIGVYVGRPFEGSTYDRIIEELGPVEYYVNDRFGEPLIVADDDLGGTFTFLRALEDYDLSPDLAAEDIGRAWLNYLIENRAILWWGGAGNSTEHTAWLNLKKGIPAPASGSIAVNGAAVAEQIGAQIFIDGWALVSPGKPNQAVKLAEQAASVSHDGEAVYAAMLWAAMEAEAFRSRDIDHLIDTGLSFIPADCLVARLISDIRAWRREYEDWREARRLIEDTYGYDKFPGSCHIIPNHALMIMTVLYAPHDFHKAQIIVNTSGWDTDCNAGNVGCLLGIMLGLDALNAGPDWRGPVADQLLISSADGGNSINDAVRMAYYIANLGRSLDGQLPLPDPKQGARFHFSLPGSTQGFTVPPDIPDADGIIIENTAFEEVNALSISYPALDAANPAVVTTRTFTPRDAMNMRQYDLMASPLVYPGQIVRARVVADGANAGDISFALRIRHYGNTNELVDIDGTSVTLAGGAEIVLEWTLPDCHAQPIAEIGLVLKSAAEPGRVILDYLRWDGCPRLTLKRPAGIWDGSPQFNLEAPAPAGDAWHRAWVNGVHIFSKKFADSFHISQDYGDGLIIQGTRDWTDYQVGLQLTHHMGPYCGVTVRTQGLRRYYAVRLLLDQRIQIVRMLDDDCVVLAETNMKVELEVPVALSIMAVGNRISVRCDGVTLSFEDLTEQAIPSGGVGILVREGAASTNEIRIGPPPKVSDGPQPGP